MTATLLGSREGDTSRRKTAEQRLRGILAADEEGQWITIRNPGGREDVEGEGQDLRRGNQACGGKHLEQRDRQPVCVYM